ncbi:MAG TPA: DUF2723 domain-containing protein [Phycisphaerae bacterium]|nr:DUF2723 domain-containing protein [Phycisphaerae bacterium]
MTAGLGEPTAHDFDAQSCGRDGARGALVGYLAVLAACMILYGLTAAPDVVWQDSGMAILRAWRGDVAGWLGLALSHPSYYLPAQLLMKLPLGEPAWRLNVFSALCAAVAVANCWLLIRRLTGVSAGAAVGAAALAVSHTFWWHAAVAEVYAPAAAGMTTEWLLLLAYMRGGQGIWLALLAMLNGWDVANHMLCVFPTIGYIVILIYRTRAGRCPIGHWLIAALCWLVGFGPMLWLMVGQLWAGNSVAAVFRSLLFGGGSGRGGYGNAVLNLRVSGRGLIRSAEYLLLNFPTPIGLLAVAGLITARRRAALPKAMRRLLTGLLIAFGLFAIRYNVPDWLVFFWPFYIVLSVFIGLGATWFLLGARRWWVPVTLCVAIAPAAVYALLPGVARNWPVSLGVGRSIPYRDGYRYFLQPWKTGYHGARQFGVEALTAAEPDGVLIADSTILPVLKYLQEVDGISGHVTVQGFADHCFYGPAVITRQTIDSVLRSGRFVGVCSDHPTYVPDWLSEAARRKPGARFTLRRTGVIHQVTWTGADAR